MVSERRFRVVTNDSLATTANHEEHAPDGARLPVKILPMTEEMLPAVCDLHMVAFVGLMSTRLGRRYVHAFISWFVRSKSAIALVAATGEDVVVGYVIGAPVGYTAALNRELAWVGARTILARPWLLFNSRMLATLRARQSFMFGSAAADTSGLPVPAMSLVGIGVAPAAAGRRVGSALLQGFESRARALKMAALRLSVYPDNSAARRLYERCGWHALPQPPNSTGTVYYGLVIR